MTTKNDIEKACSELNSTPVPAVIENLWGESPVLDARDIVIPKILIMQGLSKLVMGGERRPGEFVDSVTTLELPKKLSVLPFKMVKYYTIYKKSPGSTSFEWDSIVPITSANMDLPYSENLAGGVELQRQYTYQFFVLLEGSPMPYAISLKSASGAAAGRIIATQMYIINKRLGKSPAAYWLDLNTEKKENDKGIFFELKVRLGKASTPEEVSEAFTWLKTMEGKNVKVDEHEEERNTPPTMPIDSSNLNY